MLRIVVCYLDGWHTLQKKKKMLAEILLFRFERWIKVERTLFVLTLLSSNHFKSVRASCARTSLLAEVSHDERGKMKRQERDSAGFWRVVWWSRRPNFWSKFTSFQNRFCLMCNAHALVDCTLIIIEPTVDYSFHERDLRASKGTYHLVKKKKKTRKFRLKVKWNSNFP